MASQLQKLMNLKYYLQVFFVIASSTVLAQEGTTSHGEKSIGINASMGFIFRFDEFQKLHPVDSLTRFQSVDRDPWLTQFGLSYNSNINSWFGYTVNVNFNEGKNEAFNVGSGISRDYNGQQVTPRQLRSYSYQFAALELVSEFDMLFKNPEDAFLLRLGVSTLYMDRKDSYWEEVRGSEEVITSVTYKRTGRAFRFLIGFSYEEFLNAHWGFRINFTTYPELLFSPEKLFISNVIISSNELPDQVISRGGKLYDNSTYNEIINLDAYLLGISLMYQF